MVTSPIEVETAFAEATVHKAEYRYVCSSKDNQQLSGLQQVQETNNKTQSELAEMAKDPANKLYYFPDLKIPTDRINIQGESIRLGFCMIANREFKEGEAIFLNESVMIPDDCTICLEIKD